MSLLSVPFPGKVLTRLSTFQGFFLRIIRRLDKRFGKVR